MTRALRFLFLLPLLAGQLAPAEHVLVSGGPAMQKWEDFRVEEDQHDRWWANFIRAATLRMAEIRLAYGKDAALVWLVYRPGYESRGREDGIPYTTWIAEQAAKRNCQLIWFSSGNDFLSKLNSRPRNSVETFDFFGHSNKYAFMFDYGSDIMAVSKAWFHERDVSRVNSAIFKSNAYCKSWGCHTGSSMSDVWRSKVGIPLEGAMGKTTYTMVGRGEMPVGSGGWKR